MWIILKSPVNNIWIWIITNKYLATITHKASWVMELIIQSTKILRKTNGLLFVNKIRKVLYKFSRFIKSSWLKWCFQIIEQNYITRNCFKCLWIGLIYPKWCFTYTLQGILYYKPAVFGTPCHPRGAWLTKRPGLANKTRIVWLWPLSIAYVWPRYVLSASFTCVHLFARNPLCVLKICCRISVDLLSISFWWR